MWTNLKALLIVILIASVTFRVAKRFDSFFISSKDFIRRRNVWYLLTASAFLAPNFWLFSIIAIPTMAIAGRKDTNPSALYLLLLQVVPPVNVPVPMVGVSSLFDINNQLLLCFCVMTPVAMKCFRSKATNGRLFGPMDYCLLSYGVLTAILYLHTETPDGSLYPSSATESLRRFVIFTFSTFVPFFAISRSVRTRELLIDTIATYSLNCAMLSLIAVVESAKGWLLYGELAARWGNSVPLFTLYVTRGTSLRAMASTGHAMILGHSLVIAFGFWLYLMSRLKSRGPRAGGIGVFWSGLMAAYTRGAWIGGLLVYFAFAALNPRGVSKVVKAMALAMVVAVPIWLSPIGDRIVAVLPFLGGKVDTFNVIYRERLFARSWAIIQKSPVWGDQSAMLKMEDLRQGQGIIDLVNTYMGILLENGFAGMSLFLAFIFMALRRAWSTSRGYMERDPDMSILGASLVACILTTLVMIWNESFAGTAALFYALAALAVGYSSFANAISPPPTQQGVGLESR